jgi:catechol 2,3-dioxygenase-like lactoylglutathione lyase family enzyme
VPDHIRLDHLAVAAEDAWDLLDRYRGDLGGRFVTGAIDPGFHWSQVRYPDGISIEMLEPEPGHEFDFLRRFLDRNGPGPHHFTFKVPDIHEAIARAEAAGYPTASQNLDIEEWKEAFLHPRDSHGVVIQFMWTSGEGMEEVPPEVMTPARAKRPARLNEVVHLVADLDGALGLFEETLDGERGDESDARLGKTVSLCWPGGGRISLVEPADPAAQAWMGDRPGRVHHVDFSIDDPARVRGARPRGDGTYVVPPEYNLGTRLLLRPLSG